MSFVYRCRPGILVLFLGLVLTASGCRRGQTTANQNNVNGTNQGKSVRFEDPTKQQDNLEGTWAIVEQLEEGKSVAQERLQGRMLVFAGNQMSFVVSPARKLDYHIKLDRTTDPKSIDAVPAVATPNVQPLRGIYRLEKDKLTIVIHNAKNSVRPSNFKSGLESPNTRVWVLKRATP